MSILLSQSEDVSTIQLDGDIDIAVAAQLKAALLEALASGRAISVSLEAATALDVTAFQLLWSAKGDARQIGLKFVITPELSEPIRSSLASAGLDGLLDG